MNAKKCNPLFFLLLGILLSGCGMLNPTSLESTAEYTLAIPGLTKEYNFLYMTDAHVVEADASASEEERSYVNQRLDMFVDASGTRSAEQFKNWIALASKEKVDAILLGGDLIDSPSSSNLHLLNNVFSKLNTPYLYTVGNHDWTYPWEYMTEVGQTQLLPLLSQYMDNNPAIHFLDFNEFIVVSVDNSSNQIHPSVMDEYLRILSLGKPVILMLHVPLMTDSLLEESKKEWNNGVVLGGGVNGGIYPNDLSAQFIQLTTAKDSPVVAVLAGHVHFSHTSDIQGEKTIPQIVGDAGFKGASAKILVTGKIKNTN